MKKQLMTFLCAVLVLCSVSGAAFAAELDSAPPEVISELALPLETAQMTTAYPAEMRFSEESGVCRLEKVYYLTANDDPAAIPTGDFEREGRTYTLLDLLKNDQTETDTREHIEVVTLESSTKDTVIYTAVFSSTDKATANKNGEQSSFDWLWLLLPAAALTLGGCGYAGYKGFKHYQNKKRGYE